jgi:hypothetical protein
MNATEAINRIVDLLGIKFKSEKFYSTKLEDGETEITNNSEGELAIGDVVYIIKDATMVPAPSGEHKTREGLIIKLDEASVITEIMDGNMEDTEEVSANIITETKDDMMSSDTLADGTKIETDESGDFKVGQQLYFITESGEKVKAPSGEHTTQSGITVVTDGEGIITGVKYPDKTGEGSLQEDLNKMKEAMSEMVSLISELNKFKSEFENLKTDFEKFKAEPDRLPVVKQFSKVGFGDMLDMKLELIKSSRR